MHHFDKTMFWSFLAGVAFLLFPYLGKYTSGESLIAEEPQGTRKRQEWPLFRGNRQRTGRAQGSLALPLQLKWSYEAGHAIESSAAIAEGTVFVGALDGSFHAVNLETGKTQWKYGAPAGVSSSPCVAEGTVYFGDNEGNFFALESATGKLRWTFKTGAEDNIFSDIFCGGSSVRLL